MHVIFIWWWSCIFKTILTAFWSYWNIYDTLTSKYMDAVTKPFVKPLQMQRIMFTIQRSGGACATIWMSNGPGLDNKFLVPIERSRRPQHASSAIMQLEPSVELYHCANELPLTVPVEVPTLRAGEANCSYAYVSLEALNIITPTCFCTVVSSYINFNEARPNENNIHKINKIKLYLWILKKGMNSFFHSQLRLCLHPK